MVRTKAMYRHGGEELAEFYCAECLDAGRVAVNFDDSFESQTRRKIANKLEKERTLSLVMVGKFYGSGRGYGHLNQYRFVFVVSRIEKAEVVLNKTPDPGVLKKDLRRVRCQ